MTLAFAMGASMTLLAGCGASGGGIVKADSVATQKTDAARVHTELGQKYLQQGQLETALEKLTKALEYDPGYVDAHTVIAVLYERINDPAKAEEHYKRASDLKPKGGNEANNYATFLCKLGRYDQAQSYFERALADPFYKTPAVALANSGACLLKAGKRDEAEAALRKALDLRPNQGEALIQLASALYEKGEYFKARAFVQRFEANGESRPDALLLGRNIELHLGNGRAAGDYTRKLMQTFPESEQARSLNIQSPS
ncbi:MAG: type IV pilus biogenesis/stability protein PilW [Dokdonella sp.]|uniref:type IV pilus biogenesis/stability protein PilW n=1 Tax=Dokdonella sp. TaxID=2291710 RepID=UPI003264389E